MKLKMILVIALFISAACGRVENSTYVSGPESTHLPAKTALEGGDVIRNGDSTNFLSPNSVTPYSDVEFDDLKHHLNDQRVLKQFRGFKDRNVDDRLI